MVTAVECVQNSWIMCSLLLFFYTVQCQQRSHSDDDFTATADQAPEKTAATRFADEDDDEDEDDDAEDADNVRVNAWFPVTIALQAWLVGMASIFRIVPSFLSYKHLLAVAHKKTEGEIH